MNAADVADAADRSALLRLAHRVAPALLIAAIVGAAGWMYREHEARQQMQETLVEVRSEMRGMAASLDAERERVRAIEMRQQAAEMLGARQDERIVGMAASVSRIETLVQQMYRRSAGADQ